MSKIVTDGTFVTSQLQGQFRSRVIHDIKFLQCFIDTLGSMDVKQLTLLISMSLYEMAEKVKFCYYWDILVQRVPQLC